jgi:flagellar basal-body rod protein FlgB
VPVSNREAPSVTHEGCAGLAARIGKGPASDKLGFLELAPIPAEWRYSMEPVFLNKLVSQNNEWLSVRQAAIAENIANANTPGFGAKDVEPFVSVISKTHLAMTATHGSHLGQTMEAAKASDMEKADSWNVTHSGNSVSLEQELMKAGEVARDHSLNASIAKSFHKMYLAAVRP